MRARAHILPTDVIGRIDPRIYGHFIEHLGRVVYDGVWAGLGSPAADDAGYHRGVVDALRAIKPGLVRYPGGNFASAYHFEDGIGPVDRRPVRWDPAWKAEETNRFGTDEYIAWCRRIGAEPYLCVNAGNGTAEEAARWVEYCNRRGNTEPVRRRIANGFPEPHDVRRWAIGNELYGDWQIGHCDAVECARRTRDFAHAMLTVDPALQLVGIGTRHDQQWNWEMITRSGRWFRDLSVHCYVHLKDPTLGELLASSAYVDQVLRTVAGTIDGARQAGGVAHPIGIALDEWNLWYHQKQSDDDHEHAQITAVKDGLFTASVLNVFHRWSHRLSCANFALTLNALGMMHTRPGDARVCLTPQYLAYLLYATRTGTHAVRAHVDGDGYRSDVKLVYGGTQDIAVPYLDVSATWSPDARRLFLHVVNRHEREAIECDLDLGGFAPTSGTATTLGGGDPDARNTFARPDTVRLGATVPVTASERMTYAFPPLSATVIELA